MFELAQVKLDFSTGNCGPEQQKVHASSKMVQSQPLKESPSQAQQTWISSSRAHRSCQGIWQTLEMRSRPSILSSQNNTKQGKHAVQSNLTHLEENKYSSGFCHIPLIIFT